MCACFRRRGDLLCRRVGCERRVGGGLGLVVRGIRSGLGSMLGFGLLSLGFGGGRGRSCRVDGGRGSRVLVWSFECEVVGGSGWLSCLDAVEWCR